jgi:hypothetical protein
MPYLVNCRRLSADPSCRMTPLKCVVNASAATAAEKSTVTRTASSLWLYLYLVGSYPLAPSHSAIAVIVLENSAVGIRTVTLRMISLPGVFLDIEHTFVVNKSVRRN